MDAARVQVYNLIQQVQQVPTQLLLAVGCLSVLSFAILVSSNPNASKSATFLLTLSSVVSWTVHRRSCASTAA